MDDLELKIKRKEKELKELKNKNKTKKLNEQLNTLKTIRELPYFKGKKDNEIIDLIKSKFSSQNNFTNIH